MENPTKYESWSGSREPWMPIWLTFSGFPAEMNLCHGRYQAVANEGEQRACENGCEFSILSRLNQTRPQCYFSVEEDHWKNGRKYDPCF